MIRLYAVDVSALSDPVLYEKCYLRCDRKRREKADAFRNSEDKGRCIAAGLLLAYAYKKFRSEYIKELAQANSLTMHFKCRTWLLGKMENRSLARMTEGFSRFGLICRTPGIW